MTRHFNKVPFLSLPSKRPLQHQIKLLQELTWVNKDLVQFQNQFPILMWEQYSILWVMEWAKAEKMVRGQGNQEFQKPLYWMMVRVQGLLCCFPCTELKLSQLHVTTPLKNAISIPAFTFQGKTWLAVLHSSKTVCSMSNSGMRHRNEY